MPENLVYPFKYHTKMKDVFLRDRHSWESGKSAIGDQPLDYRYGLLSFMDLGYQRLGELEGNATSGVAARLRKLGESDETSFYLMPCYNFRLLLDFCETAPLISEEIRNTFTRAVGAYRYILECYSREFLAIYAADCYDIETAELKSIWADICKDNKNYDNLANAGGKDLFVSKLVNRYKATSNEGKRFFLNEYIVTFFSRNFAKDKAGLYSATEDLLVSKLMERYLLTDDEEIRSFLKQYVAAFFSQDFPEVCKMMRKYYAKVHEIAWDMLTNKDSSFKDRS